MRSSRRAFHLQVNQDAVVERRDGLSVRRREFAVAHQHRWTADKCSRDQLGAGGHGREAGDARPQAEHCCLSLMPQSRVVDLRQISRTEFARRASSETVLSFEKKKRIYTRLDTLHDAAHAHAQARMHCTCMRRRCRTFHTTVFPQGTIKVVCLGRFTAGTVCAQRAF